MNYQLNQISLLFENLISSWQRFNLIAPDNSVGSNAIEELKAAVFRMPAEFQEYITVGESIRYPANMFLPLSKEEETVVLDNLKAIRETGNRINILYAYFLPWITSLSSLFSLFFILSSLFSLFYHL